MRPDIEGLDAVADRVHTSDTIMRLGAPPTSLAIIGGGFIAAEFAHVFSAYGVHVTVIHRGQRMLAREDAEIARRYTRAAASYVDLRLNTRVIRADAAADGVRLSLDGPDGPSEVTAELVLIATGRHPNGDRLGVEAAASSWTPTVTSSWTPTADHRRGRLGAGGCLLPWAAQARRQPRGADRPAQPAPPGRAPQQRRPPGAARGVHAPADCLRGATEDAARAAGLDVAVAVQEFGSVAYGWATADDTGCCKLVADRATGRPSAPTSSACRRRCSSNR